ncbi:hypothetical protein PMIN06_006300 [Paraphaeosphaeria minitans]
MERVRRNFSLARPISGTTLGSTVKMQRYGAKQHMRICVQVGARVRAKSPSLAAVPPVSSDPFLPKLDATHWWQAYSSSSGHWQKWVIRGVQLVFGAGCGGANGRNLVGT